MKKYLFFNLGELKGNVIKNGAFGIETIFISMSSKENQ
jgi:hypothetical protein